jgi:hypothetical protein
MIRTFPVLAGAYRARLPHASWLLTHACEVGADGFPTRVLCRRVKLDSICADLCVATDEAPTCPACRARWERLGKEARA